MTADECNSPLDVKLPRPRYVKRQNVGRPKFELVKRKAFDSFASMDVIVGSSRPYWRELRIGKGTVRMVGFFPALDYWKQGAANPERYGMLHYPKAHREFFRNRVLKGVRRRAATSDPLVELSLLEGEQADILVFSNWNGRETEVEFAVRDVPRYRKVATVNAALSGVKAGQGVLRGKVRLEGGAVVYCRK